MRKRSSTAVAALVAAIAVPAIVIAATNAYTSPTLKVRYAGAATVISASAAVADDATAVAAIYVPTGTAITATQAPGTQLGTVNAQVSALALGGALLPLTGPIVVAPPGVVPAAAQALCTQGATPTAVWLLQLTAAGQTINLPAYLIPTAGAETARGPAKLVFCLAPPDIPVDKGGATFGAKFLSAELTLNGVFGAVQAGAWIAFWTPWQAGTGQLNAAGTVASPAAVAPGSVTVKAKKAGIGAVVSGVVTQAGQARGGVPVQVFAGLTRATLKKLATVKSKGSGTYSYNAKVGKYFRVKAIAPAAAAAPLCAALTPLLGGIPCVNPTVNGFTAQSPAVARK